MSEINPESTETPDGAQSPANEPQEDSFPRSYVEELRQEAAEARTKAKSADLYRDALREAALKAASNGVLHEPLEWSDEFDSEETGLPDPDKIAAAVEALAADKPWLSRPRGDVGAGFRGESSDAVDLAAILRGGA